MLRAFLLLPLLAGVSVARVAPVQQGSPPIAPPPALPPVDRSPSDPAALGFLTGSVDPRVYSLEAAGAGKLVSTVHVAWEGRADVPPACDFEVTCDYAAGSIAQRPLANPPESLKPLLGMLYAHGQVVVSLLPSRAIAAYVVTFTKEGDVTRLDYKPRASGAPERGHQEWYAKDGTPLRRKIETVTADGTPASQEVTCEYIEADGRLLLKSQKATDPKVHFSIDYEYEKVDGFRVMKRVVQKFDDLHLIMDFKSKIEAAPK